MLLRLRGDLLCGACCAVIFCAGHAAPSVSSFNDAAMQRCWAAVSALPRSYICAPKCATADKFTYQRFRLSVTVSPSSSCAYRGRFRIMSTPAEAWKPNDFSTLSMLLAFSDRKCAEAIKVYEKVLGAKQMCDPVTMGDPAVITHVVMKLGESTIMMNDHFSDEFPRGPAAAFVYVPDVDETCKLAKEAGFKVKEPEDMFWGDRMAHTTDPFGHNWTIATLKKQVTPEEMAEGAKIMAAEYKSGAKQ
eukprot:jgi/Ulvmu1/3617/UM017_0029.1